eukprot:SAG31_NODE_836_length_11643_cov_3.389813_3_plen_74_part_00
MACPGATFLTRPAEEKDRSNFEMLKEVLPMLVFMFSPARLWELIKNISILRVGPGRKEMYLWNGYEYGFVNRP